MVAALVDKYQAALPTGMMRMNMVMTVEPTNWEKEDAAEEPR